MKGKHREVPILPNDVGIQKGGQRLATRGPHHAMARASPWPRHHVVWRPWPTTGSAPSRTSSPGNPKTQGAIKKIFRHLHEAENNREKSSPTGRNLPGKFLPGGGKSSPSSPLSRWTSLGSSSSSSSSSPSSPPLHSVPL